MTFFLLSLTSLFTLMNPLGVVPVFITMTEGMTDQEISSIAKKASLTAFICLLLFALTGMWLFSFFNISLDSLKVVGGVLFFLMGYDMLQARVSRVKDGHSERTVQQIGSNVAITPLAIPMIAGPGSITAVVVMMNEAGTLLNKSALFGVIALMSFLTYLMLRFSKSIIKVIGEKASKVFLRIMGLIVMMIAVEFFFAGLTPFIRRMIAH